LLKEHDVRYLLIGAYAVNYHGYIRATGDMDIWIAIDPDNANKIVAVLREFGFDDDPEIKPGLFLQEKKIISQEITAEKNWKKMIVCDLYVFQGSEG
jgi:hypothetical protein